MTNKFKLLFCLLAICVISSCSKDDSAPSSDYPKSLSFEVQSSASFEDGDEIAVRAYGSDDIPLQACVLYTYSNGSFSSSDPIVEESAGEISYYRAVYPYATINDDLTLYFEVKENQNEGDNLSLSDLQYSYSTSTSFSFQHLMPKIFVNVVSDNSSATNITATIKLVSGVEYNLSDLTSTPDASTKSITMSNDSNSCYSAFVAPQNISAGSTFITISVDGVEYICDAIEDSLSLLNGEEYTIDVEFIEGAMITTYWYEEATDVPQGWIGIYTAEQLAKIGVDSEYPLDGSYILMRDITLFENWTPIGGVDYNNNVLLNITNSYPFTGIFDGDDHTISGILVSSDKTYLGLFGYIEGATIENLILYAPEIYIIKDAPYTQNIGYNGCIAGYASNSTITRCGVADGAVCGYKYTGGVVGCIVDTELVSCYFNGSAESLGAYAGGIAAYAESSKIVACYNTGTVGDCAYEGGIVGWSKNIYMIGCYNTGETTNGYTCNGSLIGCATGDNDETYGLTACYYLDTWGKSAIGQNLAGYSDSGYSSFAMYGDGTFAQSMNAAISGAGYTNIEYTVSEYGYCPSLMGESLAYPSVE